MRESDLGRGERTGASSKLARTSYRCLLPVPGPELDCSTLPLTCLPGTRLAPDAPKSPAAFIPSPRMSSSPLWPSAVAPAPARPRTPSSQGRGRVSGEAGERPCCDPIATEGSSPTETFGPPSCSEKRGLEGGSGRRGLGGSCKVKRGSSRRRRRQRWHLSARGLLAQPSQRSTSDGAFANRQPRRQRAGAKVDPRPLSPQRPLLPPPFIAPVLGPPPAAAL